MISKNISVELPPGATDRADRYIALKEILTRGQIKARDLHVYDREGGKELKLSHKVKKRRLPLPRVAGGNRAYSGTGKS